MRSNVFKNGPSLYPSVYEMQLSKKMVDFNDTHHFSTKERSWELTTSPKTALPAAPANLCVRLAPSVREPRFSLSTKRSASNAERAMTSARSMLSSGRANDRRAVVTLETCSPRPVPGTLYLIHGEFRKGVRCGARFFVALARQEKPMGSGLEI